MVTEQLSAVLSTLRWAPLSCCTCFTFSPPLPTILPNMPLSNLTSSVTELATYALIISTAAWTCAAVPETSALQGSAFVSMWICAPLSFCICFTALPLKSRMWLTRWNGNCSAWELPPARAGGSPPALCSNRNQALEMTSASTPFFKRGPCRIIVRKPSARSSSMFPVKSLSPERITTRYFSEKLRCSRAKRLISSFSLVSTRPFLKQGTLMKVTLTVWRVSTVVDVGCCCTSSGLGSGW
mmetsp:Transcript_109137/g.336906  ORF Transcript_109137/g.336906 Transcript_109137/m.336906 type:complete len:240 (-) Transcript_109137:644-1363(-)